MLLHALTRRCVHPTPNRASKQHYKHHCQAAEAAAGFIDRMASVVNLDMLMPG
jgi:hypothetical protein